MRSVAEIDQVQVCDQNNPNVYYASGIVRDMIDDLAFQLKSNATSFPRTENISNTTLNTAGEMFLYINFCPDSLKPWLLFYEDLFEKHLATNILLTLNRILKAGSNNSRDKSYKIIAEKLFSKLRTSLESTRNEGNSMTSEGKHNPLSEFSGFTHPVHLVSKTGNISPSAFIPFCEFGGKKSAMEFQSEHFDVPICNSFEPKILNDELCYEVDVNKFNTDNINTKKELKSGLIFMMDYKEDRQIILNPDKQNEKDRSFHGRIFKSEDNHNAIIHLDTIGISTITNRII